MPLQTFALFIPACFALNMAFGPNNLLSLTHGAKRGVRTALRAAIGRLLAFAIMIAIVAGGMGALLTTSEKVFSAVKWAGAAYLCWIGLRLLLSKEPLNKGEAADNEAKTLGRFVRQEFMVAAGNPKAILIFTAFFPQFVQPTAYWESFGIIGATFLALEMVAVAVYSFVGARIKGATRGAKALRWVNSVSGCTMVVFGIALAMARRPGTLSPGQP